MDKSKTIPFSKQILSIESSPQVMQLVAVTPSEKCSFILFELKDRDVCIGVHFIQYLAVIKKKIIQNDEPYSLAIVIFIIFYLKQIKVLQHHFVQLE